MRENGLTEVEDPFDVASRCVLGHIGGIWTKRDLSDGLSAERLTSWNGGLFQRGSADL
jgi:hypothetical protein